MCGIAGIVGNTWSLSEGMQRMMHALRHRGPDGEGTEQDAHAIFGHRRLSIIDLAGGRQPLTNADKSVWVVCNGEIYNYRELRADLERGGYRFLTQSDCEVIIALYEKHGDALLEHLRGMFAFALWDAPNRRLLAARDHLGQKPFYYARTSRGFAFASEIKALLAFDPALRNLNLAALDQYLALRLIAPPLSMFEGVQKLPPAHSLVLEDGREPVIRRYWQLDYQPKRSGSEHDLLDELESQIEESLRLHLVSDVPVGAFLSGGLDSSLLVAMLAKRVGVKNLPTFTVGLPHARFDHSSHQLVDCASCHTRATTSQDSGELLLPDVATCGQCHRPGSQTAESRCFECHTYHDESQRKTAPGRFTLHELSSKIPSSKNNRLGQFGGEVG